ncbi:hypothetical protein N431DRAFT_513816, partial [Stipitochalara longipes BDJ]
RSLNGCWTCRLRRKKCDELRPGCARCERLSVKCLKYGPKPEYMDGASKEKNKLEEIKSAIKAAKVYNRLLRLVSSYKIFDDNLSLDTKAPESHTTHLSHIHMQSDSSLHDLPELALSSSTPIILPFAEDPEIERGILLMRYMEEVLYIQFPFYNDTLSHHGRGWVLSLITNVKPVYFTALALGSYHKDVEKLQGNETKTFEHYMQNYSRAIIELRCYIDNASDSDAMEYTFHVSFCILQLIFCELFRGEDNCQMHLHAVSSLIYPLALTRPKISTLSLEHQNAIDTIVGEFVALDILWAASTRSPSLLRTDYKQWLRDRNIELQYLIGCDVAVMLLISQISELEQWKTEFISRNRLSIMELCKRAGIIEKALVDFITINSSNVKEAISALKSKNSTLIPTPNTTELNIHVISSVFALSAVTYLHVVVSGTHPELFEIQQSISQTLLILKSLPHPQLLRHMVWPFCITGCLVSRELENELRDMATLAGASKSGHFGTMGLWKSLKIMEDCWNRRDQNGMCQDWTAAMSRLGNKVLLF